MPHSLPQHDPDPRGRARLLDRARRQYRVTFDYLGGFGTAAELPPRELPALRWLWIGTRNFSWIFLNNLWIALRSGPRHWGAQLRLAAERLRLTEARGLPGFIIWLAQGRAHGRPRSTADLRGLFGLLDPDPATQDGLSDALFAELRVAGPNPLELTRVRAPPADLGLDDPDTLGPLGMSIAEAIAAKALYIADYRALRGTKGASFPCQKFLAAPVAVFGRPPQGQSLVPIGIQLNEDDWVRPGDGPAWQTARLAVQSADVHMHQAVHHLARTHLLLGAIALHTRRELSARHPLSALLSPHFEGNLFINWLAKRSLVAPGGSVAALLAPDLDSVLAVTVSALKDVDFGALALPAELAARGVDDPSALPHYPYRDSGMLIWTAISSFVDRILLHTYPSDGLLIEDTELQRWIRSLEDPAGGRLRGVSEQDGGVQTRAHLGGLLTHIIFRASAQHAALNFPQLGVMGNPEVFPLALYAEPTPQADPLDCLPDMNQAHAQINLGQILGGLCHTRLGTYPPGTFTSPPLKAALRAFRTDLRTVEATLRARYPTYPTLYPSKIPQSTNI